MSTRDKLLGALLRDPTESVSGSSLARRLGVTRASIWKAASALKTEGYPLQSRGRLGYRFDPAFDVSLFTLANSPTTPARRIHYQTMVRSTQTLAKQAALLSAPSGSVWVAELQTAGRGRLDRVWDSGRGGLWFSLLLRPALPAARVPPLTLVAALRLSRVIEAVTGVAAKVKWPNDVVVECPRGRWAKLAGILTEMAGDIDRTHWVVMGIGVNVNNTLPRSLAGIAASLRTLTGKAWPRAKILQRFLAEFDADSRVFERDGFAAFRDRYWAAYGRPDAELRLRTSRGDVHGRARGIDASGAIILESRRQHQHFSEGEIIQ